MPKPSPRDDAETISHGEILARLSDELEKQTLALGVLEWSISALLDKVNHPDLGEEIHVLQDIDRLQQTFGDIAAVIRVVSEQSQSKNIPESILSSAMRLASFRDRLGLSGVASEPDDHGASPVQHDDERGITWF